MKAQHPETWAAERIIKLLEEGGLPPWKKGWLSVMPQNMLSKREYTGLNRWMLMMAPYSKPFFLTLKNVQSIGGRVKREEFSNFWPVYFWMVKERESDNGDSYKSLFCKGYKVWNIEQCESVDEAKIPNIDHKFIHDPIEECEKIVSGYKKSPPVLHIGGRCCYSPSKDEINMPLPESFEKREEYYSSLFHEFGHSTGHVSRLGRDLNNFDKHNYSKEELVAEFCSAMLCAVAGIEQATIENNAAYIHGWLKQLKGNSDMLVFASREANKACNMIIDKKYDAKED